jgi:TPR repeat protein
MENGPRGYRDRQAILSVFRGVHEPWNGGCRHSSDGRISGRIPVLTLAFTILRMAIALAAGQARAQTYGPGAYENVPKFIALVFSCLFMFSMPAKANDADSFNAMVALANKGVAEAQYHAGMMYNNGIGTQKDPKQAFEWFQRSAASNDPLGAYKLGCYYAGQFDVHQASRRRLASLIAEEYQSLLSSILER